MEDLKKLKELLKLLRAQGVLQYQSQELNLVLSEHWQPPRPKSADIEIGEEVTPTEEEIERLLFYSATPPADPNTDPNSNS